MSMKKETSRRGLFEKAAWSAAAALALSCPAVAADSCCGGGDWLLDPSRYKAVVREAGGAWILENGKRYTRDERATLAQAVDMERAIADDLKKHVEKWTKG